MLSETLSRLSPSLLPASVATWPAREFKFLMHEQQASRVQELLRGDLRPDPHGVPSRAGSVYEITTLYGDTPAWDVFFGRGKLSRHKYRVRRYGRADTAYLERKSKHRTIVSKHRSQISLEELAWLAPDSVAPPHWRGEWFRNPIRERQFAAKLAVRYCREAYFGHDSPAPLRVTFDRSIAGTPCDQWCFDRFAEWSPILENIVLMEFKFRGDLPSCLKKVLEVLEIQPATVSKYRLCLTACGLAPVVSHAVEMQPISSKPVVTNSDA